MKRNHPFPLALFLSLTTLCCLGTSCVRYTAYQNEPRRKVIFASARAAQNFYDGYVSLGTPYGNGEVKAGLFIANPLPYWKNTVPTENVKFNAEIQVADTNHNGVISEKEARVYSEKISSARHQKWEHAKRSPLSDIQPPDSPERPYSKL